MSQNNKKKDASSMLKMAVDILEEEIAAGILAAKKMEKKVFDLKDNPTERPAELMGRIRHDIHEAVDLFMDSFTVLTGYLENINGNFKQHQNGQVKNDQHKNEAPASVPVIKNEVPIAPGATIALEFNVTNKDSEKPMDIHLSKPDLVNIKGQKINAGNISLSASKFQLAPNAGRIVTLKIKTPKSAPAGNFNGLIRDLADPNVHILVILEIA